MKYLIIFSLAFSFNIFAQESENKYEPVSNKAEYFFGTFNKGKDLEDLMDWYDDFADWMLVDEYKEAVSSAVQRLGVKARAAGIHLIFAAQRPDNNVFPMQLRDNLGNRLILRVESVGTSLISLGQKGGECLLGKGHLAAKLPGESDLIYTQVPFLSNEEFSLVAEAIKQDLSQNL